MTVPRKSQPQAKKAEMLAAQRSPYFLSLEDHDIALIKALYKGTASADEQRAAFNCIITKICKIGGVSLNSDPILMAGNEGMRMVAAHLLKIATEPYDKLMKENFNA